MCPKCQGLGFVDDVDERQLIDPNKSLNEGAMTFAGFQPGTWRWKEYGNSGLFDLDKKLKTTPMKNTICSCTLRNKN